MHLLILLATCGVGAAWFLWRFKNRRMMRMAGKIPGPPALPLLGNALLFMVDSERFIKTIEQLISEYGDVTKIWLGPDLNIIVKNPNDLKLLLASPKTAAKGPQYKYMVDMIGGGILSGSGPIWRKHRKIATPNYGKRAVESYNLIFHEEAEILVQELRKNTEETNAYDFIVTATSIAVCRTLMGLTRQETLNLPQFYKVIQESPRLYNTVFERMTKWYLQIDPIFWMTEHHMHEKGFLKILSEFSTSIIGHRIEKLKKKGEFSKDLLEGEEDSADNTKLSVIDRFILSKELDNKEMLDETFTIFTSSQEATAKIASYFILMIAFHPVCQDKLYADIVEVIGEEDRPVNEKDFRRMPYLDMVYKEVVRLFPIGAMLQRTVLEDVEISSHTIPAGASLVAPIFQLHRDPRFWQNPDAFDPERFTPENLKLRNPNAYIPFSAGPMDCLGRHFGTSLVKTLCVRLLKNFEVVSSLTYKDLRVSIVISVQSIIGYPVTFKPRKKL